MQQTLLQHGPSPVKVNNRRRNAQESLPVYSTPPSVPRLVQTFEGNIHLETMRRRGATGCRIPNSVARSNVHDGVTRKLDASLSCTVTATLFHPFLFPSASSQFHGPTGKVISPRFDALKSQPRGRVGVLKRSKVPATVFN